MARAQPPSAERTRAFVALGSNLGDRAAQLVGARAALDASETTRVVAASRIWETDPVGPSGQGPYLNAVVALDARMEPRALLERLLEIEREAGRDRGAEPVRWGPRVLDLDLLLFGALRLEEPGLTIPHPRLHERSFVLEPLCEIAADLVHPSTGLRMDEHLRRCRSPGDARPFEDGAHAWKPLD